MDLQRQIQDMHASTFWKLLNKLGYLRARALGRRGR
jgi:hypothetical protein